METLYRKYRPKKFSEIVGQDHVKRILMRALEEGRVSHAYIFAGPRGTGKTTTARILAKALNCERRKGPEPCGECHACRAIDEGTFMDVVELDAASNRGIDEIRRIREAASYRPIEGKYKVYIIDEVHMLTREAFNALLKTLEEPPQHVVFVLATTDLEKVPQTIVSRCQVLEFRNLPDDPIVERLKEISRNEGIDITERALKFIAKRSLGSMRDALTILERVWKYAGKEIDVEDVENALGLVRSEIVDEFIDSIVRGDLKRIEKIVDDVYYSGKELDVLFQEAVDRTLEMISEGRVEMIRLSREFLNAVKEIRFFENKKAFALAYSFSLVSRIESEEPEKTEKKEEKEKDILREREVPQRVKRLMDYLLREGDLSLYVSLSLADSIVEEGNEITVYHSKGRELHHEILKQHLFELEEILKDITGENVVLKPQIVGESKKEKEIVTKMVSLFGGTPIKEEKR